MVCVGNKNKLCKVHKNILRFIEQEKLINLSLADMKAQLSPLMPI